MLRPSSDKQVRYVDNVREREVGAARQRMRRRQDRHLPLGEDRRAAELGMDVIRAVQDPSLCPSR